MDLFLMAFPGRILRDGFICLMFNLYLIPYSVTWVTSSVIDRYCNVPRDCRYSGQMGSEAHMLEHATILVFVQGRTSLVTSLGFRVFRVTRNQQANH